MECDSSKLLEAFFKFQQAFLKQELNVPVSIELDAYSFNSFFGERQFHLNYDRTFTDDFTFSGTKFKKVN